VPSVPSDALGGPWYCSFEVRTTSGGPSGTSWAMAGVSTSLVPVSPPAPGTKVTCPLDGSTDCTSFGSTTSTGQPGTAFPPGCHA